MDAAKMSGQQPTYPSIEDSVGNTPLVRLKRIPGTAGERSGNIILAKLEGNNPAGSVKDRPALSMVVRAEQRGTIRPGDTLIEATSGNTGIALAMAAAMRGYRMVLIMPEHLSVERRQTMRAFGAELILTPQAGGMEGARDLAEKMRDRGEGVILDQFANPDNPLAHYEGTGPEIWRDTAGKITHFVSSMGTTGTIMGVSRFLKERNPNIQIVGCQPTEGSQIPGIRKWPEAYLPKIYDAARVDRVESVSQADAGGCGSEECGHRFHRLRSGRSLSVHRCVSRLRPDGTCTCLRHRNRAGLRGFEAAVRPRSGAFRQGRGGDCISAPAHGRQP
jgi:cysteine synthase B